MNSAERALIQWYENEFVRRTIATYAGEGEAVWAVVSSRLPWTDVIFKAEDLGLRLPPSRLWLWWMDLRDWASWRKDIDTRFSKANSED